MKRAAWLLVFAACKGKDPAPAPPPPPPVVRDAASPDATTAWPGLEKFPLVEPVRVVSLPAKPDRPRFDVGGPVIAGDVAIVSSSQLGFAAIDWRRGKIVWTKPAGAHVAPPLAVEHSAILVGECLSPPANVPDTLLGCLRVVVAATGTDETYTAIHGGAAIAKFAIEPGAQHLWRDGEHAVRWRRGDLAVSVDLVTGVATPAPIEPPPIRVFYEGKKWDVAQSEKDGTIHARGILATDWATKHPYTALIGAIYLRDLAPMIRVANVGTFGGLAELNLLDIDATGSLHGQAAFPVPAIALLASGTNEIGDTALAIRMDATLHHDFIAGYAANALLMWVYPLPDEPRADPVGVAVAPDAVLAFHDGDTFTVLPELSAPPTAPGTPPAPSQNPTP